MFQRQINRRSFIAGAAGVVATLPLTAPAIAQARREWRFQTTAAAGSAALEELTRFGDSVTRSTGGQLKVTVLAAGPSAVAQAADLADAVSAGKIEMGHGNPSPYEAKVPGTTLLLAIPFGLMASEQNAWIEHGGGQELGDRMFAPAGLKFFALGNTDIQMGGWFKKELRTPDELRGLKIRIGGPGLEVMKAMGAAPINIANGPPVREAFDKGTIDAAEATTPAADMAIKLYEVTKNFYYPNWNEPGAMLSLFINKAAWDALPDDQKAALANAAAVANARYLQRMTVDNGVAITTLVKQFGVELKKFPDAIWAELKKTSAVVVPQLAAKDPMSKAVYDS